MKRAELLVRNCWRISTINEVSIFVGHAVKVEVDFISTASIQVDSFSNLDLINTVYVPSMRKNYISISKLVIYCYNLYVCISNLICLLILVLLSIEIRLMD